MVHIVLCTPSVSWIGPARPHMPHVSPRLHRSANLPLRECRVIWGAPQDMQSIMSAAVMRWWPEAMVPMNRDPVAVREAQALWEANNLYEPFDITGIVAARYGVSCATSIQWR